MLAPSMKTHIVDSRVGSQWAEVRRVVRRVAQGTLARAGSLPEELRKCRIERRRDRLPQAETVPEDNPVVAHHKLRIAPRRGRTWAAEVAVY